MTEQKSLEQLKTEMEAARLDARAARAHEQTVMCALEQAESDRIAAEWSEKEARRALCGGPRSEPERGTEMTMCDWCGELEPGGQLVRFEDHWRCYDCAGCCTCDQRAANDSSLCEECGRTEPHEERDDDWEDRWDDE